MGRVEEAFAAQPRAAFLPADVRAQAAYDGPLPLPQGQTSSQPRTVADMLHLLDVQPGHRVLDVGAGSGWTTALLAHLTGEDGRVLGVEVLPELLRVGTVNVAARGMAWASVHRAVPGLLGLPEHAPFDRILVSAEAPEVPGELRAQLGYDGRMVVPVAGRMLVVTHHEVTQHGHYRFVPLVRPPTA